MPETSTSRWSHYRLIREIGRGGTGQVFEARRVLPLQQERPCAIKFLREDLLRSVDPLVRLAKEGLAGWDHCHHPNLLAYYDFAIWPDGRPFIVTEYVDGPDLAQVVDWLRGDFPMIRRIAHDVTEALFHLHTHGITHRDVALQNILMSPTGVLKLADLSLAKDHHAPDSGTICGIPAYVAPEVLAGRPATVASDLYALGAVLYELTTGHPPYGSGGWNEVAQRMRQGAPEPLPAEAPADLAEFITELLASHQHRPSLPDAIAKLCASDQPVASDDVVSDFATAWNDHTTSERDARRRTLELVPLDVAAREYLAKLDAPQAQPIRQAEGSAGSSARAERAPSKSERRDCPEVGRSASPWMFAATLALLATVVAIYALQPRPEPETADDSSQAASTATASTEPETSTRDGRDRHCPDVDPHAIPGPMPEKRSQRQADPVKQSRARAARPAATSTTSEPTLSRREPVVLIAPEMELPGTYPIPTR